MQVIDLDGHSSHWALKGGIAHGQATRKSDLHLEARSIIHKYYPTLQVLEEIPVYVRKGEVLYLDFYLPLLKKCIEVHGRQHYEFVRFYHNTTLGFIKHQKRDKDKKEWCSLNRIQYIELPYNQTEQWEQLIAHGN